MIRGKSDCHDMICQHERKRRQQHSERQPVVYTVTTHAFTVSINMTVRSIVRIRPVTWMAAKFAHHDRILTSHKSKSSITSFEAVSSSSQSAPLDVFCSKVVILGQTIHQLSVNDKRSCGRMITASRRCRSTFHVLLCLGYLGLLPTTCSFDISVDRIETQGSEIRQRSFSQSRQEADPTNRNGGANTPTWRQLAMTIQTDDSTGQYNNITSGNYGGGYVTGTTGGGGGGTTTTTTSATGAPAAGGGGNTAATGATPAAGGGGYTAATGAPTGTVGGGNIAAATGAPGTPGNLAGGTAGTQAPTGDTTSSANGLNTVGDDASIGGGTQTTTTGDDTFGNSNSTGNGNGATSSNLTTTGDYSGGNSFGAVPTQAPTRRKKQHKSIKDGINKGINNLKNKKKPTVADLQNQSAAVVKDPNVWIAAVVLSVVGFFFMLFVVHQLVENPRGCIPKMCRCLVACFRIVCWPCRKLCCCCCPGGEPRGRGRGRGGRTGVPMEDEDDFSRDLELT
jgi:hypothetical protein